MPAALIEVGFMSNATDLATLKSESGREKIAQDIFVAFGVFKKRYDGSVNADSAAPAQDKVQSKATKSETDTPASAASSPAQKAVYGTQVLASGKLLDKNDPFFKGYPVTVVKSGSIYKYIIGTASTTEKAKENYSKIRKSYSGCFMVVVKGDMVTILK